MTQSLKERLMDGYRWPPHLTPMMTRWPEKEVPTPGYHEMCGCLKSSGYRLPKGLTFGRPDLLDVLRMPAPEWKRMSMAETLRRYGSLE